MKTEEVVQIVSNYVNSISHKPEDFIAHMSCQHRTLQQSFTRLCLAWFQHLASLEDNQYDLRNAESVRISKMVVTALGDDDYLPMI